MGPSGTYVYPASVDFSKFDRSLFNVDLLRQQNLTDAESDAIPVIVQEWGFHSLGASELASASGATANVELESIEAAAGNVSKVRANATAADLAADPRVRHVALDVKYSVTMTNATERVAANRTRARYGVTGDGVTVAILDSGVDESHPAINGSEVAERDFTGEGTTTDVVGHGTHVAGIVTGNDTSPDGMTGIAPDAGVLDVRVLDSNGRGRTSDIIQGMEYATENADVISMSLGGSAGSVPQNDPLVQAVDNATAHGTPVVVAAGNYLNYRSTGVGHGMIETPGVAERAITVGATTDDGRVAPFSDRGPTPYAYGLKPDVVAPGELVRSANASTDGYASHNGTSMATPVVSGTAALLLEEHPNLTPTELRGRLTTTADPLGPEWDVYSQGTGEINALDAIGTNVTITPGTVDFGVHNTPGTIDRTITITNHGDRSRSFTPNLTLRTVDTTAVDSIGPGNATLNRSSITVGPGESRNLTITVDTDVPSGIYGGRVSLDGGNYTAVFGYTVASNLTITKAGKGDTPVDGDTISIVPTGVTPQSAVPPLDVVGRDVAQFSGDTVRFQVIGREEFGVMTHGRYEPTNETVVLSETVQVDGDTSFSLDEEATTTLAIDVDEISQREGALVNHSVALTYSRLFGIRRTVVSVDPVSHPDTGRIWVSEGRDLSVTLSYVLSAANASTEDPSMNASAIYNIGAGTTGIFGPTTLTVDLESFNRHELNYHRVARDQQYDLQLRTVGGFARRVGDGGSFYRDHQVVYQRQSPFGFQAWVTEPGSQDDEWEFVVREPRLSRNENATVSDINRHPFATTFNWTVDDGTVNVSVTPNVVEPDVRLLGDGVTTATLSVAGQPIHTTSLPSQLMTLETTPSPGEDVGLRLTSNTTLSNLSTRITVAANATYRPNGDSTPPMIRSVRAVELTRDNYVTNDTARFLVDLEENDALQAWWAPANGSVSLPSTNGTGWRPADVSDPDADGVPLVSVQAGNYSGPFHLALNASDDSGNTASLLVENANRLKGLPPTARARIIGGNGTAELNVTAVNFTAGASEDDGSLAAFRWDYDGDGAVEEVTDGPNASHVYRSLGTFQPRVTVVDVAGNTNSTTVGTITVEDTLPPSVRVRHNGSTPRIGTPVLFDARNSTDNGEIVSYEWSFGPAGNATGPRVTQTWGSNGTKDVSLTVTDASGNRMNASETLFVGNRRPIPAIESPVSVTPGGTGTLRATDTVDPDGHDLSYAWDQIAGPDATFSGRTGERVQFTAPNASGATLTFELTASDEYGAANATIVDVAVEPDDSSGGGSDGGDDGDGDGGSDTDDTGGSAAPPPADTDPEPSVSVTGISPEDPTLLVNVSHASAGTPVTVDVGDRPLPAITGISVTPVNDGSFDFSLAHHDDPPDDATTLGTSTDAHALRYETITHGDVSIENVTYAFAVPADRLDAHDADREGLALYRYEDGEWVEKSTAFDGESNGTLSFTATTDGFSTYAIGVEPAMDIAVTDAAVDRSTVAPGETVGIEATIQNRGDGDGNRTVGLSIDDEVVTSRSVNLAAGATTTISFTHTFGANGTYAVAVNETAAGTVTVRRNATVTGEATSPTPTSTVDMDGQMGTPTEENGGATPPSDGGLPLVAILVALGLLSAVVVGLVYRDRVMK